MSRKHNFKVTMHSLKQQKSMSKVILLSAKKDQEK